MGQWLELFRTLKNLDASPQTPGTREYSLDTFINARRQHRRRMAQVSKLYSRVPSVCPSIPLKNASQTASLERDVARLARWILKNRPNEVHVRRMLREVRLPGLRSADRVKAAAKVLVEVGWLSEPIIGFGAQSKVAFPVNSQLWEEAP